MKAPFIITLVFCLQLAISPLCLCLGAGGASESGQPSCCVVPETNEEPAPCPHCDQEMPMSATTPGNAHFDADPPEWNGIEQFFQSESVEALSSEGAPGFASRISVHSGLPPLPTQAFLGVFLI